MYLINIIGHEMDEVKPEAKKSRYGTLGLDVGVVGRWSRLIWGLFILVPLGFSIFQSFVSSNPEVNITGKFYSLSDPVNFYTVTVFYFIVILFAYAAVYWFLGERILKRTNAWINTLIFVGPALIVAWWEFTLGPITGVSLPVTFQLAMLLYIGISFVIQWKIKYGGCEVVSVPILLFKKRYETYCIPLVAIDAVEKVVVDRKK